MLFVALILFLYSKWKSPIPNKTPTVFAIKSKTFPSRPTKRTSCKISVNPAYISPKINAITKIRTLLLVSLYGIRWPHMIKKAKIPNMRRWIALSGSSQSQKLVTSGKKSPGRPVSTNIKSAQSVPGKKLRYFFKRFFSLPFNQALVGIRT